MSAEWKSQQTDGKYSLQFETDNKENYKLMEKVAQMIIDGKSADVTEIVHGKWIDEIGAVDTVVGMRMTIVTGYKCSVCGHSENEKYPFCNCGAKMDKE